MRCMRCSHARGLLNQGAFLQRDGAGNRVGIRDREARERAIHLPEGAA